MLRVRSPIRSEMKKLKTWGWVIGLLGLVACATPPTLDGAEEVILERLRAVRACRQEIADVWPGFSDPRYDVPMLYYTDSICYGVNLPPMFEDSLGARLVHEEPGLSLYKLPLPDSLPFHMETTLEFLDSTRYNYLRPMIVCSSPEMVVRVVPDVTSDQAWMPMVLHEYAHGYQYAHGAFCRRVAEALPSHPETELERLHKRCAWFDRAIRAENETLLDALATEDTSLWRAYIQRFLTQRAARKARMAAEMGNSAVRDEAFFELMEGMARYIEAEAGFHLGSYTERDTWLYDTDHAGYFFVTGYNLMRLFDRLGVDKQRFYADSIRPLELYLRETGVYE